jgi:hypothetical protein
MMPMLINLSFVLSVIISYFLLQAVGRRIIMLAGIKVGGVANMFMALGFFIMDQAMAGTILLFIGVFLYGFNYGLTIGPVGWLYIA